MTDSLEAQARALAERAARTMECSGNDAHTVFATGETAAIILTALQDAAEARESKRADVRSMWCKHGYPNCDLCVKDAEARGRQQEGARLLEIVEAAVRDVLMSLRARATETADGK